MAVDVAEGGRSRGQSPHDLQTAPPSRRLRNSVRAARPRALAGRLADLPARWALAGIVGLSFAVRWLASLVHTTPQYFPDEYIYASLARSIAESGTLEIRGDAARFPAILEPLLAAPFWLAGDPELAYRLTQGLHALAMSLAAVPVYLLARRVGAGKWLAVGTGALAVVSPALLFVSFVTADAIAYPLVLAAVYVGVRALETPTARLQIGFAALAGLATFARMQYIFLPAAFFLAALIFHRGRALQVVRRFRVSVVLYAVPAVGLLVVGANRLLGYYSSVTDLGVDPGAFVYWWATDAMMVAYAAGWVIAPGALLGLLLGLFRPRTLSERAFAALFATVGSFVFFQAVLYATNGTDRFQERYFISLFPLVGVAFALWIARGAPAGRVVALVSLALLALSARVPLAGYAASINKQDSPFLLAIFELERRIGTDLGSLVAAAVAAGLALFAAVTALRPRLAPLALGAALAASAVVSVGALSFDAEAERVVRRLGAPDLRWVDHADVGRVTLIQTPGTARPFPLEQLFWNTSIEEMVLFDTASSIDAFRATRVTADSDGRLVGRRRTISNAVLVSTYALQPTFADATLVARGGVFELWKPRGTARLSTLVSGRWREGWLARGGDFTAWRDGSGRVRGTLRFELSLPEGAQRTPLLLETPRGKRTVWIAPGERRAFSYDVSSTRPWQLRWGTSRPGYLSDNRLVSVQSSDFRFTRAG